MSATLEGVETFEVHLVSGEGRSYTRRITGKRITWHNDVEVFLTEDERVIVYNGWKREHWEVTEPAVALRHHLDDASYVEAMEALGEKPVIDL